MSRKYNIDVLRIVSALAVIVIHVVSAPVSNAAGEVPRALKETLSLVHTLINWAVPVFS